ncbi:Protein BASIC PENTACYSTEINE2-like [Asimina triloba]
MLELLQVLRSNQLPMHYKVGDLAADGISNGERGEAGIELGFERGFGYERRGNRRGMADRAMPANRLVAERGQRLFCWSKSNAVDGLSVFGAPVHSLLHWGFTAVPLGSASMEDDGGLGIRNWGYYEQSLKGNLGLQLMPSIMERDQKPMFSGRDSNIALHGGFLNRDCGIPPSTVPMDFVRDSWMHQREKFLQAVPLNPHFSVLSEASTTHPMQNLPMPEAARDERPMQVEEADSKKDGPLKKRHEGRACKPPKPKKNKRNPATQKEEGNGSVPNAKPAKKRMDLVINGIDVDISGIPIPVCSCTGTPQQCYRWGCGGWQSACCTTSISMYPLPMSNKRRGARIAGRKMSLGAFKKVLEKLAGEGHNLSHPIDLKNHWAKHGTNKFVTIR